MYYLIKTKKEHYGNGKIVNIKDSLQLYKLQKENEICELIETEIIELDLRTLRQFGYRNQSCCIYSPSNKQDYSFFNYDIFPKLSIFSKATKFIVNKINRGEESRDKIIGYVNSDGKEILIKCMDNHISYVQSREKPNDRIKEIKIN